MIPNDKGKETLSTGAASNVSAVLSRCQGWREMVLTKTFNIGKKPLESEHTQVHIFKENLFPVRNRTFPPDTVQLSSTYSTAIINWITMPNPQAFKSISNPSQFLMI